MDCSRQVPCPRPCQLASPCPQGPHTTACIAPAPRPNHLTALAIYRSSWLHPTPVSWHIGLHMVPGLRRAGVDHAVTLTLRSSVLGTLHMARKNEMKAQLLGGCWYEAKEDRRQADPNQLQAQQVSKQQACTLLHLLRLAYAPRRSWGCVDGQGCLTSPAPLAQRWDNSATALHRA